jgi:hypothetical protein
MNPLQVPQQGPYGEEEACLQGILHISQTPHLLGSPVKEPSLKVPFMESLEQRCPTTIALPSSLKVPGIRAASPHIPVKGLMKFRGNSYPTTLHI